MTSLINLTAIGRYTTILCTKNKTKVLPIVVDTSNIKNVKMGKVCLRINEKIKNKQNKATVE